MLHTPIVTPPFNPQSLAANSRESRRRKKHGVQEQTSASDRGACAGSTSTSLRELGTHPQPQTQPTKIHLRTMTWPSKVKLIGPVHHRQNTEINTSSNVTACVGHTQPDAYRYRWSSDGNAGHTYRKKNFWNLQRIGGSRCPSANSTQTATAACLHSQGSHLSLHQSKAMDERELQYYFNVNLQLAPGFKPLQSREPPRPQVSEQPVVHRYPHPLSPNAVSSMMVIKQLPSKPHTPSHSWQMGRTSQSAPLPRTPFHLASERLSSRHLMSRASVLSDRPGARPCTPADGLPARKSAVSEEEGCVDQATPEPPPGNEEGGKQNKDHESSESDDDYDPPEDREDS